MSDTRTIREQVRDITPEALRFMDTYGDSVTPLPEGVLVRFGDARYGDTCGSLLQVAEVYVGSADGTGLEAVRLVFGRDLCEGEAGFSTIQAEDSAFSGLVNIDELGCEQLDRVRSALQILGGTAVNPQSGISSYS